jgi:Spy/CpxP family protein refolding chaperone
MMNRRITVLACTILVLACVTLLCASEEKGSGCPGCHGRLNALAARLGLSAQQTEEIHKIHTAFAQQAAPLRRQLKAAHHEKREAMRKVFTEEQRGKVKQILKAERETRWQATVARLNLGDAQRQRVEQIRQEYAKRFEALSRQAGENKRHQCRALRHEKYQALARELSVEQRARLRERVRQELAQRHDAAARVAFWTSVGEKLGVSPEQKKQLQQIQADSAAKLAKPATQLKELRREAHAAVAKVLTEEQRAKLRERKQAGGRCKGKPAVEGKG